MSTSRLHLQPNWPDFSLGRQTVRSSEGGDGQQDWQENQADERDCGRDQSDQDVLLGETIFSPGWRGQKVRLLTERPELIHLSIRNEIDVVRRSCNYRAFNLSFFFSSSSLILLCTFAVFGLTGETLTAEKAFLAVSMFNKVRVNMTSCFPFAIGQIEEARASIKRIQVK